MQVVRTRRCLLRDCGDPAMNTTSELDTELTSRDDSDRDSLLKTLVGEVKSLRQQVSDLSRSMELLSTRKLQQNDEQCNEEPLCQK